MASDDGVRVIAGKVRALRDARGWSGARLAEEMTRLGVPWDRSTVAKLETGRRSTVSVAELVALGMALQVTPVALAVDLHAPHVDIAPGVRVLPYELLLWMLGHRPLGAPPLNLEIGEYQPPGLPWGEMQPDALLVEGIDRAWYDVQDHHRQARPAPFGAPTQEERDAAAERVARGVDGLRKLLTLAERRGIAIPQEIRDYVEKRGSSDGS